jgi:aryl-alcohol dehydrogenase-like predicted oxidoreductase
VPHFKGETMKADQNLVEMLGRIPKRKNAPRAQIAQAWLLAGSRGLSLSKHHQAAPVDKQSVVQP